MENNILYRACIVDLGTSTKRGMFHKWTFDGGAIIEGEYGECNIYPCSSIRFLKPTINDYVQDFYEEDMKQKGKDDYFINTMSDDL